MVRLDPKERAGLPDRAFAYVDSRGRRRLPIHDPAHVRNALARFGQVTFEDDAARDRAGTRLLQGRQEVQDRAGRVHRRPVAVGTCARRSGAGPCAALGVRHDADDRHRRLDGAGAAGSASATASCSTRCARSSVGPSAMRAATRSRPAPTSSSPCSKRRGRPSTRPSPCSGSCSAGRSSVDDLDVRVRIGIHSGYPTSTASNYIGVDVNTRVPHLSGRPRRPDRRVRQHAGSRQGVRARRACASAPSAPTACAACRSRCRCSRSWRRVCRPASRRCAPPPFTRRVGSEFGSGLLHPWRWNESSDGQRPTWPDGVERGEGRAAGAGHVEVGDERERRRPGLLVAQRGVLPTVSRNQSRKSGSASITPPPTK